MKNLSLTALLGSVVLTGAAWAQTAAPLAPPPATPVNHEFNFWLGDWDVFRTGTDQKIGDSRVESVSDGYGLQENWTSLGSPITGKSLNSYDAHAHEWQQFYIASNSGLKIYRGNLVDGKMVLIAESFTLKRFRYLTRGTWTPNADGSVRQQFEISIDGGTTWQLNFDGLYKRKPKK